jgi:4-hydroxybutyrate CoA-transferase
LESLGDEAMKRLAHFSEVLSILRPHSCVVLHSGCAEPRRLSAALGRHAAALHGIRLYTLMPMGGTPPYAAASADSISVNTFFPGRGLRGAVSSRRAQLLRMPLSGIPKLFDDGTLKTDVLMLQLSPPDEHGQMSLGISVDYMRAVLAQRPTVIAEINPAMPRTCGDTLLREDHVDYVLESEVPPQAVPRTEPDPVDRRIAQNVAGLISHRAVIQTGIGTLPDLVLGQLGSLTGLGVHTGIITDALLPLLKKGVVTNETKRRFPGRCITTMAAGTQQFYNALHQNSAVEFHPCSLTHDVDVIAAIEGFCAINAVLQIDLVGRANAEQVGGRVISGPGGLPDFARGASRARNGMSIIALRSIAKDGTGSIRDALPPEIPVTVTTADIDYVVTEHGVARVRNLDGWRRAQALIRVAHPEFRAELRRHVAA